MVCKFAWCNSANSRVRVELQELSPNNNALLNISWAVRNWQLSHAAVVLSWNQLDQYICWTLLCTLSIYLINHHFCCVGWGKSRKSIWFYFGLFVWANGPKQEKQMGEKWKFPTCQLQERRKASKGTASMSEFIQRCLKGFQKSREGHVLVWKHSRDRHHVRVCLRGFTVLPYSTNFHIFSVWSRSVLARYDGPNEQGGD